MSDVKPHGKRRNPEQEPPGKAGARVEGLSFDEWFRRATGNEPFPYQRRFAEEGEMPNLVDVPTGLGKTAMAVLGWLWRRRFAEEKSRKATPRRLVYCLPMRVLVEQTVENAKTWLKNLSLLAEEAQKPGASEKIAVYVLMGGDVNDEWIIYPERDAILVGTQDVLLSRALNRGYAMSRFQWPRSFALLNNDCLWALDEVQLMGPGLATTAQLDAFRQRLGTFGKCHVLWMSATLQKAWLNTVDFRPPDEEPFGLQEGDKKHRDLKKRLEAVKQLSLIGGLSFSEKDYARRVAEKVNDLHQPGSLTLVIVNTVQRAKAIYRALDETVHAQGMRHRRNRREKEEEQTTAKPELILIHSRFRLPERRLLNTRLMSPVSPEGRIVVATQVVEAGVDISARVLFTELAPWASLVQRFGRCNRYGEYEDAQIFWIDITQDTKAKTNSAAPYDFVALDTGREQLQALEKEDAAWSKIAALQVELPYKPRHVIRRRDLVELFDTSPDLSGNDVDVSRFIRDDEERDVQVFWRDTNDWPDGVSPGQHVRPHRDELCSAPISEVRDWLKSQASWRWDYLDGEWMRVGRNDLRPGMVLLVKSDAGGYSWDSVAMAGIGWDPDSAAAVTPAPSPAGKSEMGEEATGHDPYTFSRSWQLLSDHSDGVAGQAQAILDRVSDFALPAGVTQAVILGARCHDVGKSHEKFQETLRRSNPNNPPPQDDAIWAKSPGKGGRHERPYFRHELAGALAVLQNKNAISLLTDGAWDLVAYLVACHHGKVRLSIRSVPGESGPGDGRRYALGIWDGDSLPDVDLGAGLRFPPTVLDLSIMEIGLGNEGPSWTERMLSLRDREDIGPFRLAYLEALVRAADARASAIGGASHE